jgi:hypothetical protein
MFLKRLTRHKNGKRHTYRSLLGKNLEQSERPQPSLFDPPRYDKPDEDEKILVKIKDIEFERLRDLGDMWLALGLWQLLGLDTLLTECVPGGREEIFVSTVAAILACSKGF